MKAPLLLLLLLPLMGCVAHPTPAKDEWAEASSVATSFCSTEVSGKPTEPTLCVSPDEDILTYTFYPHTGEHADLQRYFWVNNLPATAKAPQPVLIHSFGYGGDTGGKSEDAAAYYGFTYISISSPLKDGAGEFGLEFGNNGVATDEKPTPCSDSDSRDISYLRGIFNWIDQRPTILDASKVYFRGFSQNSMFSLYASVCFADRVAGLWQGGSGMVKVGYDPVTPGFQGQCKLSDYLTYDKQCCKEAFCTECKYWPLYPKTCAKEKPERKLVDCIHSYTNDNIACGSDKAVFEAHVHEGNDARMLSFAPVDGVRGGHSDPENSWAWVAGCLGLSASCSSTCESSFKTCAGSTVSPAKFAECETKLKEGSLSGCAVGCSPTLGMLETSEAPVVSLSEGKFGTLDGLKETTSAPDPECAKSTGPLTSSSKKCPVPSDYTAPDFSVHPTGKCGGAPVSPSAPTPPTPPAPSPPTPKSGDTCSAECEAEYQKCTSYHSKKGSSADTCAQELANGVGRLAKVCVTGCTIAGNELLEDEWQELYK